MNENEARNQVVETGLELLNEGLVARTWGNVSCRLSDEEFLITPSGLAYTNVTPEDIAVYNRCTGKWKGERKPSSEKGIHAAAYELFPDVNFVIHTHQNYASALGLAGWDSMDITEEEKAKLGGIACAEYGLPGTDKLKNAVRSAMETGAKTVFMLKHGVVIGGESREDAMEKAKLLEEICKRNFKCNIGYVKRIKNDEAQAMMDEINAVYPNALLAHSDVLIMQANLGKSIRAQLDDMAQMIGFKIPVVKRDAKTVIKALEKNNTVIVPMLGAIVNGMDHDDSVALGMLAHKAAICSRHTENSKVKSKLGAVDVALMNFVYKKKYSKKKG